MPIHLLFARSSLNRLHQAAERNILRTHKQHARRQASTKGPNRPPPSKTIPTQNSWIDPLLRPFRAYGRMQHRSPLTTQFESTLIIYYLGDLCSQTIGTNVFIDGEYEPIRGLRMMLIGALSSIPGYKWFIFLGNHFNYKSHVLSIATKVVVNQTFFTPVFNTYFFGMQTLLSGGSWAEARERVWRTVPVSWVSSWKVWPIITAINFTFVPWQYRNVCAGVVAIGWQGYLSWLNKNAEARERDELEQKRVAQGGGVSNAARELTWRDGEEVEAPKRKRRGRKKEVVETEEGGSG